MLIDVMIACTSPKKYGTYDKIRPSKVSLRSGQFFFLDERQKTQTRLT